MKTVRVVAILVALAGASTPAVGPHSPQAQAKLDSLLAGRTAGRPSKCLATEKTGHPIAIDDSTMLFREGPRLWRTELRGSFNCGKIDPQSTIVTQSGWRVCAGDKLVFVQNGSAQGACYLGEFTPYTKTR